MPASLQAYSGKGKSANKTYYRIQPYLPSGRRVTIRLGTGKKQATAANKAIDDLIDSSTAGVEPSASTKQWLEEVAMEPLCKSLLRHKIIGQMPLRFDVDERFTTISMLADEYIRTRCAGLDEETVVIYNKARKNLIACFGDVDITKLTKRDGREFWRWLLKESKYAENTAKHRLRLARAIFELGIEDELIAINPFKARGLSVSQSAAEKEYVEQTTIDKVVKHCPTLEWELLFTLCRKVPVRVPSEIREFTWDDVDWDNNQMLIHSPKTRRIGKSARLVPIFPEVAACLKRLLDSDQANKEYVFNKLRNDTNPGTMAKKIVKRAKLEPWKNFFNSLRATAETDLMDEYGLRRACQWAGNSAGTAMKNYALVKKTDFTDAGTQSSTKIAEPKGSQPAQKSDAKSDAINDFDAKSDAESSGTDSHEFAQTQAKNALPQNHLEGQCVLVDDIGLEPTTSTMSTWRSSQLS